MAKTRRIGGVGGRQRLVALCADLGRGAIVNGRGGVIGNAGMTVLMVVVGEEGLTECARVLDGAEAFGEGRAVLHRLEPRL